MGGSVLICAWREKPPDPIRQNQKTFVWGEHLYVAHLNQKTFVWWGRDKKNPHLAAGISWLRFGIKEINLCFSFFQVQPCVRVCFL